MSEVVLEWKVSLLKGCVAELREENEELRADNARLRAEVGWIIQHENSHKAVLFGHISEENELRADNARLINELAISRRLLDVFALASTEKKDDSEKEV